MSKLLLWPWILDLLPKWRERLSGLCTRILLSYLFKDPLAYTTGLLSLVCLVFFISLPPALAAIKLELTQGVTQRIPLAMTLMEGSESPKIATDLSAVIQTDLVRSGQFRILELSPLVATPLNKENIVAWRRQRIDHVVQIHTKPLKGERYRVGFSLVNIVQTPIQPLLRQQFTVSSQQLRALAHHISDKIYYHLLGIRGVFSTRIAYILIQNQQGKNLYSLQIADADGHNAKPLLRSSQPIMSPAWSPDGRRIAYVSFEHLTPRIYIQQVASGARLLLSDYPGINGAPAWSPDARQLALALSKDTASPKIYLMDLATKRLRQITFGRSIDTEPSWSSDGKSLLFTSDRGGEPQIYQVNLTTHVVQRLTFRGSYNTSASLAPDGKTIVVLNREQGQYNIGLQDLRTGHLRILTYSGYDASPSLAPNGQVVLYESKFGRQGVLEMVSVDGRVRLRLPTPLGSVQDPNWSPLLTP